MAEAIKILLVDDEMAILDTLQILFRGEGYDVAVANSGAGSSATLLSWGQPQRLVWLGPAYLAWWIFLEVRHRLLVEGLALIVSNVAGEVGFDRVES